MIKRTPLIVAVILTVSFVAIGQTPDNKPSKMSKDERQVRELNQQWADAIVKGDTRTLDQLFADEMIVTSGNGTIRDKAGELGDLKPTPDGKTYFFNTDDVRVRVYKDAAVVTGHAKWRFSYQGKDIDNERRYTHVYIRQRGRWRIVAQQLTRIAQPPKQ
jgi:ketosteroid isomerase-like protein